MLLKYPLKHDTLKDEIINKAKTNITIIDESVRYNKPYWKFKKFFCIGTITFVHLPRVLWAEDPALRVERWECWIILDKKPWWLPCCIVRQIFKRILM